MADCIIGVYHHYGHGELVTLENLKCLIAERIAFNFECDKDGISEIKYKEYTLKDYADRRCRTNLTRFAYCPDCGKKIDWRAIKESENAAD